jgi:hypothetical protein
MPKARRFVQIAAFAAALLGQSLCASAQEVRHIPVYVQPYYEAPKTPGGPRHVAVGRSYDALLASDRREDIVAARDRVVSDPKLVTPMTMMVLAIRFYDVGLRDDAVFWFYVAKDRYITLADVVDVSRGLGEADEAVRSFASLLGPTINGYAFCDVANQQALRQKAIAWVEANPYEAMFLDQLTGRPGDRRENLKRSILGIKVNAEKERGYFDDAKNRESFAASRKKNAMDEKYCWK